MIDSPKDVIADNIFIYTLHRPLNLYDYGDAAARIIAALRATGYEIIPVLWRKRHKPNGGWRPTSRPREGTVS